MTYIPLEIWCIGFNHPKVKDRTIHKFPFIIPNRKELFKWITRTEPDLTERANKKDAIRQGAFTTMRMPAQQIF